MGNSHCSSQPLSSLFFIKKREEKKNKKNKKPRSKPFMSIFKTQPHQQYAFQLFPPSSQPATARPIINGSYRQRKGFCIIGSCCLISRRSSEPACPLFHTSSTNLQPRPAVYYCGTPGSAARGVVSSLFWLTEAISYPKSARWRHLSRAREGWREVGGKGPPKGA